jgi:hypothetical protein
VNETSDRVERGQQERQKNGKGLMHPGTEWKEGSRKGRRKRRWDTKEDE